jgi:hypothetical protein
LPVERQIAASRRIPTLSRGCRRGQQKRQCDGSDQKRNPQHAADLLHVPTQNFKREPPDVIAYSAKTG